MACNVTEGHVWVQGHVATGACVDAPGPYYSQKPCRYPRSVLPPGTMLISKRYSELAPPLTGGNLWDRWPHPLPAAAPANKSECCTSPQQHRIAHPGARSMRKLAQSHECQRSGPATPLLCGGMTMGETHSPTTSITTCSVMESWPHGHETKRACPAPHWLEHLEVWALFPTQARQ